MKKQQIIARTLGMVGLIVLTPSNAQSAAEHCAQLAGEHLPLREMVAESSLAACQTAVSESPNTPQLQYYLGRAYQRNLDFDRVEPLFVAAAEAGYLPAQKTLAEAYQIGDLGLQPDVKKAFYWSHKTAEQGDAESQFVIGTYYDQGKGVAIDVKLALQWYQRAAESGFPTAQSFLGDIYHRGKRVPQSDKLAFYWYLRAAKQNEPYAQYRVGKAYESGAGVEASAIEAVNWYVKAAEFNGLAQDALREMVERNQGVTDENRSAVDRVLQYIGD